MTAPVDPEAEPVVLAFEPAYPNPLTDAAVIRFTSARTQPVRLAVFDALGRRVAVLFEATAVAGPPVDVLFVAHALAPGAYLARLMGEGVNAVQRLTVTR